MDELAVREKVTEKKEPSTKRKRKYGTGGIICIVVIIVAITAAVIMFQDVIVKGAGAVLDSYNAALASEKDATYQSWYRKYYDTAEARYHVQNRATIKIGSIVETEKLEVLNVSDVEYIVDDDKITSWLEVSGEGTYIVDLKAAEFIVDSERSYVLVRLPYPELDNVHRVSAKSLLLEDDRFIVNGNYKEGSDLAERQLAEADLLFRKEFASNQHFYLNAQEAAISAVQCLVRQLNPEVEGLTVEVEFY